MSYTNSINVGIAAKRIVAHLEGTWKAEPQENNHDGYARYTNTETGVALSFSRIWNKENRLEIGPVVRELRDFLPYSVSQNLPSMTVDGNRDPKAIAKSITSKVIEPWLPLLAIATEGKATSDQAKDEATATYQRLSAAAGVEPGQDTTVRMYVSSSRYGDAQVRPGSPPYIHMELRGVDEAMAADIIRIFIRPAA